MKAWHDIGLVKTSWAVSFFQSCRLPYAISQTGSSLAIENGVHSWLLSAEQFWPRYLRLLAKVKSECRRGHAAGLLENMDTQPHKQYRVDVRRFPLDEGTIEASELDLSQAYLTAGRLLGLIDPATADMVAACPKRWRLRVLGAIASRKRRVEYDDGGKMLSQSTKSDPAMRACWFAMCNLVDKVLQQLAANTGDHFLFYWYDNLFCLDHGALTKATKDLEFSYRIAAAKLEYGYCPGAGLTVLVNDRRPFFLGEHRPPVRPLDYVHPVLGLMTPERAYLTSRGDVLRMVDTGQAGPPMSARQMTEELI